MEHLNYLVCFIPNKVEIGLLVSVFIYLLFMDFVTFPLLSSHGISERYRNSLFFNGFCITVYCLGSVLYAVVDSIKYILVSQLCVFFFFI